MKYIDAKINALKKEASVINKILGPIQSCKSVDEVSKLLKESTNGIYDTISYLENKKEFKGIVCQGCGTQATRKFNGEFLCDESDCEINLLTGVDGGN